MNVTSAQRIIEYFRIFQIQYNNELQRLQEQRTIPRWSCPKPTLHQCVIDLCKLFESGEFISPKFRDSIIRSFIATGTSPKQDGTYQLYSTTSSKGSIGIIPSGTVAKEEFNRDLNYVDLTELLDSEEASDDEET
mmetsp:Transcript_12420/g.17059  ORF Transcript_12420/g.17059 Transcript_12420/m.17059 type:complete len:135 (+) Transcript_12420:374-778(+)